MAMNLVQKILAARTVRGSIATGEEVVVAVDQALLQDATGTAACLQLEALGFTRPRTRVAVVYIDHNTLQSGPENANDHLFLRTFALRHGLLFSRAGNGICHQVHLERLAAPGRVLLGADSHTTTAGGVGSLALGAGGLDVAVATATGEYTLTVPGVVQVWLTGSLPPWSSAKDVVLTVLGRVGVRGGVGRAFEFAGPGVASLSVPERATITNMCTETGATTGIFPADERTRSWLEWQGRGADFVPLRADDGAAYEATVAIDLGQVVPMVACPHSPDAVVSVAEVVDIAVDQVLIGSCTNSSYRDLMVAAEVLAGGHVHPRVSLGVVPGSRQVLTMLAAGGGLEKLLAAGARILESACGPCVGMGQAPPSGAVSVRTFNRNFEGRSGTRDAGVYLVSPETAAASALAGRLTDPRTLGSYPQVVLPAQPRLDGLLFEAPPADPAGVEVVKGPTIKSLPLAPPWSGRWQGRVLIKVGDNITTDHIMPAGAHLLPLRSNIPALAEHVFGRLDPGFAARARAAGGGVIVGGRNYGQGSSREHAALCPMYLGVRVVLARSFARIHRNNLINVGILPLCIADGDYDDLREGEELNFVVGPEELAAGPEVRVGRADGSLVVTHDLSPRELEVLAAGGLLNHIRRRLLAAGGGR